MKDYEEVTVKVPRDRVAEFYHLVADWLAGLSAREQREREPVTISENARYFPLYRLLRRLAREKDEVTLTFAEIEQALGKPLPASARRLPSWWANTRARTHVQAPAWLAAGWKVVEADLERQRVLFRRSEEAMPSEEDA